MTNRLRLASLLLLLAGPAGAQNAAFDALPVPAPTAYRSASGALAQEYGTSTHGQPSASSSKLVVS